MIKHKGLMIRRWGMVALVLGLSACQVRPPAGDHIGDSIDVALRHSMTANTTVQRAGAPRLPSAVNAALMPAQSVSVEKSAPVGAKKFDINVKDVPAEQFFMGLVKGSPYNMMVDPKVSGAITMQLHSVTIPEAVDAVCEAYGLGYRQTDYGYHILPNGLETKIFTVNILDVNRMGSSSVAVGGSAGDGASEGNNSNSSSSGNAKSALASAFGGSALSSSSESGSNNTSVVTQSRSNFWMTLTKTLKAMVGTKDGRAIVVNPQAGLVIVRAHPNELREVSTYLDSAQAVMDRQVVIEAKVLEVTLNAGYQSGVNWHLLEMKLNNEGLDTNTKDFNGIFTFTPSDEGTFSMVLKLLQDQGRVQVLSSPRISTLNNQKAVIKVGGDKYFVTNISNTTVAGTTSSDSTQDINMQPFFTGIALDVTPQIGPNGHVTLHIHPIVSKVTADDRTFTVSSKEVTNLPLAATSIRESDSIVRAKSGQVIVIGGLMEDNSANYNADTPGIDKTVLNPLFTRKNYSASKTELVILLRPVVVGQETWNSELQKSLSHFQDLSHPFAYSVKSAPLTQGQHR